MTLLYDLAQRFSPLLLPDYADAPAMPWIAGGLGAISAAVGTYFSIASAEPLAGSLLLTQSVPLLSVPGVYAIRSAF